MARDLALSGRAGGHEREHRQSGRKKENPFLAEGVAEQKQKSYF
jgi:hypothetical protein